MLKSTLAVCDYCSFSVFCLTHRLGVSSDKCLKLPVKQHHNLQRKQVLYSRNDKFRNLYAVQRGALKTYRLAADGKEMIRNFYFAGEIVGYGAIFSDSYQLTAEAITEAVVCEIPYEHFLSFVNSKAEYQKYILTLISQRLNAGDYLDFPSAEQRVAAFLIDISKRLQQDKVQQIFILPMSRQDAGNYLRLTAETVSRILSRFQEKGIIHIYHKKIRIQKRESLIEIAEGNK